MDVTVTRYSFYPVRGRGTLRFTEQSPPHMHDLGDRDLCGCTTDVAVRPDGVPDSVETLVELRTGVRGRDVRLRLGLDSGRADWTVLWDARSETATFREPGEPDHAYFWFGLPDALQVGLSEVVMHLSEAGSNRIVVARRRRAVVVAQHGKPDGGAEARVSAPRDGGSPCALAVQWVTLCFTAVHEVAGCRLAPTYRLTNSLPTRRCRSSSASREQRSGGSASGPGSPSARWAVSTGIGSRTCCGG